MVTRYLLDTNVIVDLIRRRWPALQARVLGLPAREAGISAITLAELRYGAVKSADPTNQERLLQAFLASFAVFPFDAPVTIAYGQIRAALEARGTPIGPLDTLIAAHALALDLTLVTNNEREFRRVPELRVENWLRHPGNGD